MITAVVNTVDNGLIGFTLDFSNLGVVGPTRRKSLIKGIYLISNSCICFYFIELY